MHGIAFIEGIDITSGGNFYVGMGEDEFADSLSTSTRALASERVCQMAIPRDASC